MIRLVKEENVQVLHSNNRHLYISAQMRELFSRHRFGLQDLDDTGQIRDIIAGASSDYKTMTHDEEV